MGKQSDSTTPSALRVVPGVESVGPYGSYGQMPVKNTKSSLSPPLNAEAYAEGILAGDRGILSRAITIIESGAQKHFELGQQIMGLILPYTGKSVRIGITGVPGAGKSTTIEALGLYLLEIGKKVAVLAVDPTSALSKGSILGDKTRMVNLSRRREAFIRPSPSGGALGGVTRKSRETILLCEAAGFDSIIVETVGVGQSEVEVRSMVDFFLFLAITGAGDELQGIKKGIIEMADGVFINKADGDNKEKALTTCAEYNQILHYLRQATEGWETKAYTVSALTGEGIEDMWQVISDFVENTVKSGMLKHRRGQQAVSWVRRTAEDYIMGQIFGNQYIMEALKERENMLIEGSLSPAKAAKDIMEKIDELFYRKN